MVRTANRLTDEDKQTIRARIDESVATWTLERQRGSGRPLGWAELPALERLAHHAIGCSAYDLRAVELAWITEQCHQALCIGVFA